MRIWILVLLISVFCLSLGGCCQSAIKFNRAEHANIKTIGILTIDEVSEEYAIEDIESRMGSGSAYLQAGAVGAALGPILGEAVAGSKVPKTDALKVALDKQGFDFRREVYYGLMTELNNNGYTVVPVNVPRKRDMFIQDYNNIPGDVDAYLDVFGGQIGCVQASFDFSYCPWAGVHAQLVEARSGKILYRSFPYYGFVMHYNNSCFEIGCAFCSVKKDSRFCWKNFPSIISDSKAFTEGMQYALKSITQKIANDLK